MDDVEMVAIESRAREFRAALEVCDPRLLTVCLEEFPHGACGDASLLLAEYLHECGLGPFDYVCGEKCDGNDDFQSHAWLQKGDVIVDITADQFEGAPGSVIVTRSLDFHRQFEVENRHSAELRHYDERTQRVMSRAYKHVRALIA
ncbi:MAG: hypothetical protein ACJ74T_09840 [Pyrinomonadaceae bacterium]